MIEFPTIIRDECTDARIAYSLMEEGYQLFSVQQNIPGATDHQVIAVSIEKKGFIITEDKDFGDEIICRKIPGTGALLLRLSGVEINERIKLVLNALEKHSEYCSVPFPFL